MADDAAFADFVESRHPALLRSAFLLVGDRGLAEDLVQETLLRTYASWGRLRATEAALTYARTTLVRLAARRSRRRWRGELPSVDPADGVARATDTDLALDVRAALGHLPWTQRAVLVLRFLDDLSEAQTAAVLGCSVGTVKSRTSRALQALRTAHMLASTDSEARDG